MKQFYLILFALATLQSHSFRLLKEEDIPRTEESDSPVSDISTDDLAEKSDSTETSEPDNTVIVKVNDPPTVEVPKVSSKKPKVRPQFGGVSLASTGPMTFTNKMKQNLATRLKRLIENASASSGSVVSNGGGAISGTSTSTAKGLGSKSRSYVSISPISSRP